MFIRTRNDRLLNTAHVVAFEVHNKRELNYCGLYALTDKGEKGERFKIWGIQIKDNDFSYGKPEETLKKANDASIEMLNKLNNLLQKSTAEVIDFRPYIKNVVNSYFPDMVNKKARLKI